MTQLFTVIRTAFSVDSSELNAPTAEECEELIAFGKKQSILPVIYTGLKKMDLPKDRMKTVDSARNKDLRKFVLHNDALQKIEAALNEEQIPYIPLKGSVLRNLYPAPEMRTSSDIDVLVKEEDLERAVEVLETTTYFKTDHRGYHDISMIDSNVHLELHFSIKENEERIDRLLSKAWEYTAPTGQGSRYVFTPEFQIFHVVAHMCYHFLHGGLGIRPFLDLWLVRNKTEYDESLLQSMLLECEILTFYEECCKLTDVWLEGAPHTETTELLEQFCLSGGVFGSNEFKTAARQREKRYARYIISRIFPPAVQVREYYGEVCGKQHTMVYYYLKRLWRWAGRGNELKRQVKDIMSTDTAFLDTSERLIKMMGL